MKLLSSFMGQLDEWLNTYLPDIVGTKANTIRAYKASWRLLVQYLQEHKGIAANDITFDTLTYENITGFLSYVENERGCKISTRNNRLAAITSFAQYAQRQDFTKSTVFYKATQNIPFKSEDDSEERSWFTEEELKIFLDLPTPKTRTGIRDHALLSFMYATAERADEVCVTKVKDIKFLEDGKASIIVHGKGGKTRHIKISEKPAKILQKFIRYRRIENQPEEFIFPTQRNSHMSVKSIEEVFEKYIKIVRSRHPDLFQMKSYPPHSMRHTTAMHMVKAEVPLIVIKQFLGHAHLATTEIYAKMSSVELNEKIRKWDKKYWSGFDA